MGKRLFIAVDIGESTRRQIADLASEVRNHIGSHMKASWVRADRMHLTLHFFGDADVPFEDRVRCALAEPIAERPFDVSFQGLGLFPERGSPRVLWLGIRDGIGALRRVHAVLDARLARGTSRQDARGLSHRISRWHDSEIALRACKSLNSPIFRPLRGLR